MAGKTRRSKKKAPEKPKVPTQLPLDIIYNIGRQLNLEIERGVDLEPNVTAPIGHNKDLRTLTYLSRSTRDFLEPLLYRHIHLSNSVELCSFFITLASAPRLRQYVQYFGCTAPLVGPTVKKRSLPACRTIWEKHHGSHKSSIINLLDKIGLGRVAWAATLWERKKGRFMFNATFRHDAVFELLFASTLLLLPNVQTFIWKDWDGRPTPGLLTYLLDEATKADLPLMPKLKALNSWKDIDCTDDRPQFFMYRTYLWENLHTLFLNGVDLDNEFTDMLVKGSFKKNIPIKKLYIRCEAGSEKRYGMNAYPPGHSPASVQVFDIDDHDMGKNKFKTFHDLDLLEIKFTWFETRALEGSRALKAFMHAAGAPERLSLIGHPLPMQAFSTGVVHPRLKYLKVVEFMPNAMSYRHSRDSLVLMLNQLWDSKDFKRFVPNLCEIDWDHYKFRRQDLEGEDKAVWALENEDEWEDEDEDDDDGNVWDEDDLFGFGHGYMDDDDFDEEAALDDLEGFENGFGLEDLVDQLAMHFHPPPGYLH
ncbi:hypothetical protein ACHAPT_003931 [Fusarium lateritium]